jgi:diguanylate cyclase (GGDEF)-like protein/PAS domain S-box-containing protein
VDNEFYKRLLDDIADGVYFVSLDRRITYWNAGAERITGYSAAEVVGHSCAEGILRHVSHRGTQLCVNGCPLAAVMRDGEKREADVYLHHKDGYRVPVTVRGQALHDASGATVGSVEIFTTRITSPYALTEAPAELDGLDPVTHLPPRRVGERQLARLIEEVAEGESQLGLLYFDLDHFKAVNDTYGHSTGDRVLRMAGQSLANGLNRGDLPVRWGGEEFIALLPGADSAKVAATAERVRMLTENSWLQKGDQQIRVTVSIGATVASPGESAEVLLDRADGFMYQSKQSGRNRVTTDSGTLTSIAEAPILGIQIPWEMPEYLNIAG